MIYLDHAATSPMTKTAIRAYLEASKLIGNPSSVHMAGQQAREKLEAARFIFAEILSVKPREVFFTSGATESNNTIIFSQANLFYQQNYKFGHIISSVFEHPSVINPLKALEKIGWQVTYLDNFNNLEKYIRSDTALITIQYVNNETGAIHNIEEIYQIAQKHNILFHTDAVQSLPILKPRADFISLSSHKWGGPKGFGLLIAKDFQPLLFGGGQELGLRSGTQNLASAISAAHALKEVINIDQVHFDNLKNIFLNNLEIDVKINSPKNHLSKILNIRIDGFDAETLLMNLDMMGLCVSAGSACSAGTLQPSRVLQAMNLTLEEAKSSLRISFGCFTTEEEAKQGAIILSDVVKNLKQFT